MELTSLTQLAPSTATNTDTSVQVVPVTAPPVLGPDPTATGVPTHSDESATTEPDEAIVSSLDGLTLTSPSPTTQAISLPTVNIHEKGATRNERDRRRPCRATQTSPRFDLLLPGEPCAIDAEFQRYRKVLGESESKCYTRPGRLSIVNTRGDVILDVYVRYGYIETERKVITHYDKRFLVERDDFLLRNGAVEAEIVEPWVQQIVANGIVVLHGGQQDLEMFKIVEDMWASSKTVDTQNLYSYLQRDGTPGLKTCARQIFGASIQEVEHSPVEDAAMTMRLYLEKVPFDRAEAQRAYDAAQPKFVHINHNLTNTTKVPAHISTTKYVSYAKPRNTEEMALEDMVVVKVKPAKGKKKHRRHDSAHEPDGEAVDTV